MAIFEDKKKPYNPYAPGTPTARAQSQQIPAMKEIGKGAMEGTKKLARTALAATGDISRNNLGGKYTEAGLNAVARPLVDANARNQRLVATQANKTERTALGKAFPQGRLVGGNEPARIPLSDAQGYSDPLQPKRDQLNGLREQVREKLRAQPVQPMQTLTQADMPQTGPAPNSTVENWLKDSKGNVFSIKRENEGRQGLAGGYDIQPGANMAPAARQALTANYGTGYEGMPQDLVAADKRAHQEQYMQRITGGGFAPINGGSREPRFFGAQPLPSAAPEQQGPKLYTKEEIPGWQERERMNAEVLANFRQGMSDSAAMAREKLQSRTNIATQGMQNDTSRDVTGMQNRSQQEIEGARIAADAPVKQAQIRGENAAAQGQELKNKEVQDMSNLRDSYLAADTPEKKADLEGKLKGLLGKDQPEGKWIDRDVEILDAEGNPTGETKKEPVFQDPVRGVRTLTDMLYEQDAMKLLQAGKLTPEQFKEKFGYLPS